MRWAYDLWYRFGTPPWVLGARGELIELLESSGIAPCRALDLGCGVGDNAIYLAQQGFDVVGIDFSPSAIERARARAAEAGVQIAFHVDDLTSLQPGYGQFDLLVDFGTFDDLSNENRFRYQQAVEPLLNRGGLFVIWCHEWHLRWWERALLRVVPFTGVAVAPGEIEARFGDRFEIEFTRRVTNEKGYEVASALFLLRKHREFSEVRDSKALSDRK